MQDNFLVTEEKKNPNERGRFEDLGSDGGYY